MDDDAVPMDHAYSYDDDGGLEDDSSSQGAMMTTDKTELELKPGRARQQSLFDPARSLNLGDLVLGTSSTTPTDSTTAYDADTEPSPLYETSPAHELQAHLMDHNYSAGDGPAISNKRKSSPEDAAQKKSRLDFAELPSCSRASSALAPVARHGIYDPSSLLEQQQQAEEEMEGRGGMGNGEERLPSPFHDRPSTSRAAIPPRPPRRREQVGGGGGAMLEKFQAGDLADTLPPAVMNGKRGGDKSHHLATPAGRPPLHHHATPIRFVPKHEADELMMALEGGASNRPNYDDNALVMDDRMDYYLNVVMAKRGPFAREPNRGERKWMPDMGASVKMEIDEEAPSSSGLNELRPTVEDEVRAARERRHAEHQQQLAAQQQEELVVGEVNDQERQWIEMFQKMSMASQRNVLGHLIEGAEPLVVRFLQRVIEPHFQRDFISCLPAEISLKILEKLPPNSLCSIQRVCSRWASLGDDDNLWKKKCTSEYLEWLPHPTKRENGLWAQQPGHVAARSVLVPGMMSEEDLIRHRAERAGDVYGSIWMKSPHKALFLRLQRIYSNWKRRRIAGTCIFKGHDDHVITCLQLTPEMIVTGSDDNTLKVWSINEPTIEHGINDERTSHLKHILKGHSGGVWTSQVSSDGKYIVSGSTDRTVRVWSSETGKELHCLGGHTSTVRCMALHGTTLVSGSRDTTLRVWDIESGQCLQHLIGHVAAVRCVQFNGVKVASGAYDFTVKIWDAATGECVHTLQGHTNRVYSLLMDTERDVVVSGSLDTTIRVWNMTSGLCIANLVGHTSLTSGMQLRGDILVSCNADSYIRVWNIRDNQCIHRLGGNHNGHQSAITSLQFLDNGLVATSSDDGTVKLWDVTRGCFVRDLVKLSSGGSGGCIWRLKASDTLLVCAVGSRNGTEETKLILLDFDASFP